MTRYSSPRPQRTSRSSSAFPLLPFHIPKHTKLTNTSDIATSGESTNNQLYFALSGCTFVPLQVFSDRAGELIASLEKSLAAKADKLPPGLKEQYDVQLEMLKDSNVPDIEIVVFPVNMQPNSGAPPFIGLLPSIGRPFTRGSIVRVPLLHRYPSQA